MARLDPHSYVQDGQPVTERVDLSLRVDFSRHVLSGEAVLRFREASAGALDLDTRDLHVESVETTSGAKVPYELFPPEPILGARMRMELPPETRAIRIRYATARNASALQWLEPSQTAGGQHPFLYSQCQPIHARSIAPLQDTARIRVRVGARFTVPDHLRALMAAAPMGREAASSGVAIDVFEMPQPIPPYLIAFAVGDLDSRSLSPRSAVWAERTVADAAAWEFERIETMLHAAEELFGPYEWERYDLLVMPPSFPFGGMENPRLTFVTPSVLAGDRSLVSVVAHELAHAWTGNLVSNATLEHFWLNEGFTVYAERRILEALEGSEAAELHAAVGLHDLMASLRRFAQRPELTRLRTEMSGVDPDEAYSTVPYEKGYLFLRRLEELAGRERWDRFLRAYLDRYRFQSIVTDDFLRLLRDRLPGLAERASARRWLDEAGLPDDAPRPRSARLDELRLLAQKVSEGVLPDENTALRMNPTELLVFLQALPELSPEVCAQVDALLGLSRRRSLELRHTFVLAQLRAGAPEGREAARRVLLESGRMKYLRPLYTELARRPQTRALAREIYEEARASYHPIARTVVESILG
ncbi:MAG TPA: M1 family metallopeptidase [Myxococcales bacterium]|nr:M1 family metallopeptidase [Myxococcales bacterium]